MKVKELIEVLSKFDGELYVIMEDGEMGIDYGGNQPFDVRRSIIHDNSGKKTFVDGVCIFIKDGVLDV